MDKKTNKDVAEAQFLKQMKGIFPPEDKSPEPQAEPPQQSITGDNNTQTNHHENTKQTINGNGNTQISGKEINIHKGNKHPELQADNPYAVKCPQCTELVGRLTEKCDTFRCGCNVRQHFDDIEHAEHQQMLALAAQEEKERRERINLYVMLFFSACFALGLWQGFHFLTIGSGLLLMAFLKAS